MARKKSILLFGEGKTEAVFLSHLRSLYAPEIRARVLVDAGQGGDSKQVAARMIKKHLDLGNYDRALLLLDADVPHHHIPAAWLKKHNIMVVCSSPQCLEGMFLTLLDDPPPSKERHISRNWKQRFRRNHLGTDRETETLDRLKKKCCDLFPRKLIESKAKQSAALQALLDFLAD
jgi:hypothetical protein